MPRKTLLQAFRLSHLYFGVFIAPAVLFFAFTGAMQTFGLHETNRDHPNYKPARWIAVLAQIHKKQTDVLPVRKPLATSPAASAPVAIAPTATGAPAGGSLDVPAEATHHHADGLKAPESVAPTTAAQSSPAAAQTAPAAARKNPLPLRIFFLIVTLGLFWSTLTGLYMAYTYNRNKLLVTLTLLAGIVVPLILLAV